MNTRIFYSALLAFVLLGGPAHADGRVKVFILAGQSNMEGKAQNKLLEYQATNPKTADLFAHLRKDGEWITRDDVFINYLRRRGGLTIGYGSPNRTGVELELGTVLGDAFDEPVLLIKTAWGGHSLYKLFRSPSAGIPEERIQAEHEKLTEKTKKDNEKNNRNNPMPTVEGIRAEYGQSYRDMMTEVKVTLAELDTRFPALKGKTPELAGFVWFQGWNDQYNGAEVEYASNMEHFIKDVRRDLKAPKLPFVIGVMGQNQSKPAKGAMLAVQEAQLAMEKVRGFRGNVRAVRTDTLVDKAAEARYPTWRDNIEEWEKVGSDRPYHYLGSAIWFNRMGNAFADALLDLMDD
jgi:alpha-galactosidase